jgi:hypothetical protein
MPTQPRTLTAWLETADETKAFDSVLGQYGRKSVSTLLRTYSV